MKEAAMVAHATVLERLGIVALALGLAMLAFALMTPIASALEDGQATPIADAALSAHLAAVDSALARQDVIAASHALQTAYQAALASRRWQGMVAYGDAALRVAELTGTRQPGIEQARRAYLLALYRARAERSLDGALAATQSFMWLGDREVAQGCLSVARRLARNSADRARVREIAARVDDQMLSASIPGF
jgi:hypothetical protein